MKTEEPRDLEIDGVIMRRCSKCGERKSLVHYGSNKGLDLDRAYYCRPCKQESDRKSRAEKREREDLLAYEIKFQVKWCPYGEHMVPWSGFYPDERSSHGLSSKCIDCRSDYDRAKNAANPEKNRERSAAWAKANADKVRAKVQRRRALKASQYVEDFSLPVLWQRTDGRCAYCHTELIQDDRGSFEVEHIFPIALGGLHSTQNLVLSCPPCNGSKLASDPIAWTSDRDVHPYVTLTLRRAQRTPKLYVKQDENYLPYGIYGSFIGGVISMVVEADQS